jgi:hypothetical protein
MIVPVINRDGNDDQSEPTENLQEKFDTLTLLGARTLYIVSLYS